jgi:hypothetical protein
MRLSGRFSFVLRLALLAGMGASLGGCLDAVSHPLNSAPTAYDDSICNHISPSKQQVNYGCVAGTELSLSH